MTNKFHVLISEAFKLVYIKEATNSAIKKVGDQPVPATQTDPDKAEPTVPTRTVDSDDSQETNASEYLPSHIDNRELSLGSNIEAKNKDKNPTRKNAISTALNNLAMDPQYYSNLIAKGECNYDDIKDLYAKLFKRDTSFMVPHQTDIVGMREGSKNKKLIEGSSLVGGNVNTKPEDAFTMPHTKRTLVKYDWFKEGGYTQIDYPLSDDPFGKGKRDGARVATYKIKTAETPTFNSAESDNFVTMGSSKHPVDVQVLNKKDITSDTNDAKDLVKATKSKIKPLSKLPKLESKNHTALIRNNIRERLKKYIKDNSTIATLMNEVVNGHNLLGIDIDTNTAKKILAIYSKLGLREQKIFNHGTIEQSKKLLHIIETRIKSTK